MLTGLSHVSIVVPDLDAAARAIGEKYGLKAGTPMVNAEQGVRLAYIDCGNAKIELMEPSRPDSPVAKFLEKNPKGYDCHVNTGVRFPAELAPEIVVSGQYPVVIDEHELRSRVDELSFEVLRRAATEQQLAFFKNAHSMYEDRGDERGTPVILYQINVPVEAEGEAKEKKGKGVKASEAATTEEVDAGVAEKTLFANFGSKDGLGVIILSSWQFYTIQPASLYCTVIGTCVLGAFIVGAIRLAARLIPSARHRHI